MEERDKVADSAGLATCLDWTVKREGEHFRYQPYSLLMYLALSSRSPTERQQRQITNHQASQLLRAPQAYHDGVSVDVAFIQALR